MNTGRNSLVSCTEKMGKTNKLNTSLFSQAKNVKITLVFGFLGIVTAFGGPLLAQSTAPLLQQSNLVYQGAFRVPQGTTEADTFNYGGTSLAFNSANNSLFMVGHDWNQYSAEIKIPSIVNSANVNNLATATILQSFRDPTEGKLASINPSDTNSKKVGGQLVYNGKLYVTGYSYYDGSVTQDTSHFARPLTLSTTGQVKGPVKVGNQYPGFVSGYMTEIPNEWQSQFGGLALTGNCCLAIAGAQSNGPAASVFNPSNVGNVSPVPATPVVGYPSDHPLGTGWGTTNPYYNGTTHVTGIVFPLGTRSILFFGRHGVGTFCYGTGAECNDPEDNSKGTHAYPYKPQVWAYDANDLLAVKNGLKQQWEIQPYAVWNFSLPFGGTDIGGAGYDSVTNQIYLSQKCSDTNCAPIIHVFKVQGGSTTPAALNAPSNLHAQ